jgi:uncharacterized protein (TIGR01777 family)
MKILITGATGFIGKPLCRKLLERGHDVRALVRNLETAKKALPYPMEFLQWNGKAGDLNLQVFDQVNAVIHLAGEPVVGKRWSESRKKGILSSRVDTAQALIAKITENPEIRKNTRTYVSGSAIGFYGDRGDETLTERSSAGSGFLSEVCQKWEDVAKPLDELGVRRAHLRTGIVLGRNGGALKPLLTLFQSGLGGPIGDGKQWMSWIHLEDIVSQLILLVENESLRGVFNGVSPDPVTNAQFSHSLGKALHKPAILSAPAVAIKGVMGEMAETVLASQRCVPEAFVAAGFKFKYEHLDSALQEICDVEQVSGQKELLVEQWVPQSVGEVFPFFSDAKNLAELTPEFLHFKILSQSTEKVESGTLIDYQIKVHGFPMTWRTRIEEWKPEQKFVDTQLKGPYKKWNHTHRFISMKGGTLLTDRVLYQLPMGRLGNIVAGRKVTSDINTIFKYRFKVIEERFGSSS